MRAGVLIITIVLLSACSRQQASEKMAKSQAVDSSLIKKVMQKDSAIMDYVKTINMIQGSVDTLMRQAKLIKARNGETPNVSGNIIDELRAINKQMVKNQRTLVTVEMKLKQSNQSNDELADLGENLSKELNEKDSEINVMQQELFKTKSSLNTLTQQFNDSLNVINQERAQIGLMTTQGNTVYYISGTQKELKDKGIITDEGGVVGLGRVPVLSQDMSSSGFIKTDLTTQHEIPLGGILVKLVTVHPFNAYRVVHVPSQDKLMITDPSDFWSKSKYLVVIVSK